MLIAWKVGYLRTKALDRYDAEELIVVAAELDLTGMVDTLRERHPHAVLLSADSLGEALIAGHKGDSA